MAAFDTKTKIRDSIKAFKQGSLTQNSLNLFKSLGYNTDRANPFDETTFKYFRNEILPNRLEFNGEKALVEEWYYIDLLFQLSKEELTNQISLFDTKQVDQTRIETYLFFVIGLSGTNYTRTQLAQITREINRHFPMPVMILFAYNQLLTLSIINRRLHKKVAEKDVLEKVTVIKDINISEPHRAQVEILFDLSFDELRQKHNFTNFVELHNAWQKTLDTKELNKRFYSELFNWYLWAIRSVKFPNDINDDKDDSVYNSESVIRLLTRLIFVWFIKEKKLVPDSLFQQLKLKEILKNFQPHSMESSVYYRAILQNLFFATLNTPMDKDITEENKDERRRFINTLPQTGNDQYLDQTKYRYQNYFANPDKALELFSIVPFLNGGLFECLDLREGNKEIRFDGFSSTEKRQAIVPDKLFFADEFILDLNPEYGTKDKKYRVEGLINILDSYKFTITENTPLEEEIALDPELLGKVFENLLASYNPETQTTARKQTGSFYTPREIVNYMVDESLIAYFMQKLDNSHETETKLRDLFLHVIDLPEFTETETDLFIKAISEAKILDPACGSGAFPMGVLHRLVDLLNKLDPENKRWNELQIQRAIDETAGVFREGNNSEERKLRLDEIENAFDMSMNYPDYARKLFLIENCIYGVDIQQIAIQISKLRFFIALIVDQKVNDDKPNRNILSMPNLETKFVAANTLIGLDKPLQMTLMAGDVEKLEKELASIRHKIFFTRKYSAKKVLKKQEKAKREELKQALIASGFGEITATQMAGWNPFDPMQSAKFFDVETMFGFIDGFDIVIGNPPFVDIKALPKDDVKLYFKLFKTAENRINLYSIFIEKGVSILNQTGILVYINPNSILINESYRKIRKLIVDGVEKIVKLPDSVFEAATVETIILMTKRTSTNENILGVYFGKDDVIDFEKLKFHLFNRSEWKSDSESRFYIFSNKKVTRLLKEIEIDSYPLEKFLLTSLGITPYDKYKGHSEALIKNREFHASYKISDQYVPLISGKNIQRFNISTEVEEYLKYGDWLGAPREKRFFENPKIIVRQILSGDELRIVGGYSEKPIYFTQIGFSLISKTDNKEELKYILCLLNSLLISFYHKKRFLDSEKVVFQKILIANCKLLPIKISKYQKKYCAIVDYILLLKNHIRDTSFFERLIDAMVYELYLPEPIKVAGCEVLKYLDSLPQLMEGEDERNLKTIERVYKELSNPEHQVSKAMDRMDAVEEIRIIEGKQ